MWKWGLLVVGGMVVVYYFVWGPGKPSNKPVAPLTTPKDAVNKATGYLWEDKLKESYNANA